MEDFKVSFFGFKGVLYREPGIPPRSTPLGNPRFMSVFKKHLEFHRFLLDEVLFDFLICFLGRWKTSLVLVFFLWLGRAEEYKGIAWSPISVYGTGVVFWGEETTHGPQLRRYA